MTPSSPEETYQDEIWQKSRCLHLESALIADVEKILKDAAWTEVNRIGTKSVWNKADHHVIVSLVDDLQDIMTDRSQSTSRAFDSKSLVITDNYISCPTNYSTMAPPKSFLGIYSYRTEHEWNPQRDFTFGVNRMDFKRIQILGQLHQMLDIDSGYVNFNCVEAWERHSKNASERFRAYLEHCADNNEQQMLTQLSSRMPLCNYTETHDEIYTRSWLNIAVETYSSDYVVSISEKIFRCLVTPAPWIVFAGCHTVAYLESLGFDTLSDIVDHRYDCLREAQHKLANFGQVAADTIVHLKWQDFHKLKTRCQAAANHNAELLEKLRAQWPSDKQLWLEQIQDQIK